MSTGKTTAKARVLQRPRNGSARLKKKFLASLRALQFDAGKKTDSVKLVRSERA